jgi:7-carboxy-7-deazaguanine synthase
MSRVEPICICEIFGPTIQGEGSLIGGPTVFVRTGGCDYRCRWCDTSYAVDPRFRTNWTTMTAEDILARVRLLAGDQPLLISLSGGNPAMQPMAGLIRLGKGAGYRFALETQGSIARDWFAELDVLTLSPKPPSSGMVTDLRKLQDCLAAAGTAAVALKLVVLSEADYQFARQVAGWFPQLPVFLQPCNDRPAQDGEDVAAADGGIERLRWLVARVLADGWYEVRVLPQLHVLVWGNKRGR